MDYLRRGLMRLAIIAQLLLETAVDVYVDYVQKIHLGREGKTASFLGFGFHPPTEFAICTV